MTSTRAAADASRPPRVLVQLLRTGPATSAAELAAAEAVLSPTELAHCRRGSVPVRRRRALRQAALRRALAAELGVTPDSVPLVDGPSGRPQLPPGTDWDASTSGAGDLSLVAVAEGCRIGVDIERVQPWSDDALDEHWLAPAEQAALLALPEQARAVAVTRAWTQKEAVAKGRGTGLGDDLAAITTAIGRPAGAVAGWDLQDVPVPEGWVASLALSAHPAGRATEEHR